MYLTALNTFHSVSNSWTRTMLSFISRITINNWKYLSLFLLISRVQQPGSTRLNWILMKPAPIKRCTLVKMVLTSFSSGLNQNKNIFERNVISVSQSEWAVTKRNYSKMLSTVISVDLRSASIVFETIVISLNSSVEQCIVNTTWIKSLLDEYQRSYIL